MEKRYVRPDGKVVWVVFSLRRLKYADGSFEEVTTAVDITELKKAEDELRWKTAFLEAQVNSAPDGILVVDNQQKRILQNQRLLELFQVPKEIAEDDDDTRLLRHVTGQMKNPRQFLERVKHLHAHPDEVGRDEIELASGTILDRYSSPVRDQTGKYYGRIWTFRDITSSEKLKPSSASPRKWRASASWPAAWRMTSTTFWRHPNAG